MTDKHIKTQAAGRSSVSLPLWLLQSVFHVMLLNHLSARCLQQSTRVQHKLPPPSPSPPSLHSSLFHPFFFHIFLLYPSLFSILHVTIHQRHIQTHKQPHLYLHLSLRLHITAPCGRYRKTPAGSVHVLPPLHLLPPNPPRLPQPVECCCMNPTPAFIAYTCIFKVCT